ncbi:uncharacterized protein LOC110830757 [Zootermopsis nevadensis]|uniref:uncharacterized protein LOC110830757 n=1 Tax=Zootermopsis nevadensis TaxID=136037 RepID=UPI000B8E6662|nr:uncharacterized protein LOC110830757 [Zootermopsis nevadensis]
MALLSVALLLLIMVLGSHEHGMLIDPVNRSSMWRYGFNTPANYEDNQLFCGGRSVQWDQNGGKCGLCGDNYSLKLPRPNENGGTFGTGVVVAQYRAGSIIKTTTKLTANHAGHVEFRLCPLASKKDLETEDCFEKYPLRLKDGSTSYKIPGKITGEIEIDLVLPDVKCEQCVLQWTYVTGNSWGICEDGTGALGCGPQETFRTCSDISLS